jgi:hypothetical protein
MPVVCERVGKLSPRAKSGPLGLRKSKKEVSIIVNDSNDFVPEFFKTISGFVFRGSQGLIDKLS